MAGEKCPNCGGWFCGGLCVLIVIEGMCIDSKKHIDPEQHAAMRTEVENVATILTGMFSFPAQTNPQVLTFDQNYFILNYQGETGAING